MGHFIYISLNIIILSNRINNLKTIFYYIEIITLYRLNEKIKIICLIYLNH